MSFIWMESDSLFWLDYKMVNCETDIKMVSWWDRYWDDKLVRQISSTILTLKLWVWALVTNLHPYSISLSHEMKMRCDDEMVSCEMVSYEMANIYISFSQPTNHLNHHQSPSQLITSIIISIIHQPTTNLLSILEGLKTSLSSPLISLFTKPKINFFTSSISNFDDYFLWEEDGRWESNRW